MKLLRNILLAALLAGVAVLAGAQYWMSTPLAGLREPVMYEVPEGASLSRVAAELSEQGIVGWPAVLSAWGRFTGQAQRIKAGEYELEPGLTPKSLLAKLVDGKVMLYPVTLVEGWTIREVLAALAANPAIVTTLPQPANAELLLTLPGTDDTGYAEGIYFPDTYMVPRGTTDIELLAQANRLMQQQLDIVWAERAPDLPLQTPYELLTLASIVERETAVDEERPQVAGVFIRRLKKGMRLQTDPTVIYGLGDAFDGNLTRKHLLTDNPYNTYTRRGLPPTPIGMPGAASLRAAGQPDGGTTLYFVATGDPDGTHVFSETLEEHNAAVAAYISRLKQNRRADKSQ